MTALEQMCAALSPLAGGGGRVLAALDGPCASGKTTLAGQAARQLGCPLVHMDDFFLPPARKTPARLAQPGGNVDWERVRDQVLAPCPGESPPGSPPTAAIPGRMGPRCPSPPPPWCWWRGSTPSTPPCGTSTASESSGGPWPVRRARLLDRGGPELLARFQGEWVPLEDRYFQACRVRDCCQLVLSGQ